MNHNTQFTWHLFRALCRLIGGQADEVLSENAASPLLPRLFLLARDLDLLPALAIRCEEQRTDQRCLDSQHQRELNQALRDNTLRNMQISAQALKLSRCLNQIGIEPLFLKGTALLLTHGDMKIGFRKQIDIDFIVEPDDIENAGNTLLAEGYEYLVQTSIQSSAAIDTRRAMEISSAHHHLPPLVKAGYASTVELHRHFLPKRFQRSNPLSLLFDTALERQYHGARFRTPSTDQQIIHLILGTMINDGHLASRSFPIRAACDYIEVLQYAGNDMDKELVVRKCGKNLAVFSQLVEELTGYRTQSLTESSANISMRIRMMEQRYNSSTCSSVLDAYARAVHLAINLVQSPGKLPGYLQRKIKK